MAATEPEVVVPQEAYEVYVRFSHVNHPSACAYSKEIVVQHCVTRNTGSIQPETVKMIKNRK